MKRLHYVGSSVLVTDEFGDLVLEYAAALARANTSETLRFRGIPESDPGEIDYTFIVGPASEIVVESVPTATIEGPDNTQALERMRTRIAELPDQQETAHHTFSGGGGLRPQTVVPEPATEQSPLVDGLDF